MSEEKHASFFQPVIWWLSPLVIWICGLIGYLIIKSAYGCAQLSYAVLTYFGILILFAGWLGCWIWLLCKKRWLKALGSFLLMSPIIFYIFQFTYWLFITSVSSP